LSANDNCPLQCFDLAGTWNEGVQPIGL